VYICREPKETDLSLWHFRWSVHLELLFDSIRQHIEPKQKQQLLGSIAWARNLMVLEY
jgi:hypothetical protein